MKRKNYTKSFEESLIVILITLLCPVWSAVDAKFQCHPMSVMLDLNNFKELFWATLSGEYVSETFCYIPIPDNMIETKVKLNASTFQLDVILEFPQSVFHPNAQVVITDENGEDERNVHFSPRCILSGRLEHGHGMASLSYCNGWRGVITINNTDYQFEPPHPRCGNGLILIGKRNSTFLMEQVNKQKSTKQNNYPEFTMEVGIIYDQQMYDFLEKEVRAMSLEQKLNFLVTQWNAVQYEFNKKILLESKIKIVIKYINLFKNNPTWYRIGDKLNEAMSDVCNWTARIGLKLDHIHIGTGWKTGNLLGVGGSGGICQFTRCALSKTTAWGFQTSICHEIAHGIDIPHDYHPNCDSTPGPSGLMGKRKTGWSKCSAKYFKLWLGRGRGKCLMKEDVRMPQKPKQKWSLNVDTYGSGLLPAMYRSRDRYCEEKFGKGFGYISLYPEKICEIQSCAMLEPGPQFGAIRVDEEGIDGLYCGLGKICRSDSHCDNLTHANLWEPVHIQIGGWSNWSPYSKCSRTCGLGYRYSRRKCDNPSPINAEWCSGNHVKIKVCNLQPCENESFDLQIHLRQRAAETCTMLLNNNFIDRNKFLKTGSSYSNISRGLRYFSHHPYRSIKGFDNLCRLHSVSPEDCATSCFKQSECRSFEYKRSLRICDLSKETTAHHSLTNNKYWDFYEIAVDEISFFKRSHFQIVDGYDDLPRLQNISVMSCASACLRDHFCRSFGYNTFNSICQRSTTTSQKYNPQRNMYWDMYEITDDVSGKEGLCEVRCDPIDPMDEGILGHVGFMPDGTSCGSSTNSNWRCLFGKCQKLRTRTYTEFP